MRAPLAASCVSVSTVSPFAWVTRVVIRSLTASPLLSRETVIVCRSLLTCVVYFERSEPLALVSVTVCVLLPSAFRVVTSDVVVS